MLLAFGNTRRCACCGKHSICALVAQCLSVWVCGCVACSMPPFRAAAYAFHYSICEIPLFPRRPALFSFYYLMRIEPTGIQNGILMHFPFDTPQKTIKQITRKNGNFGCTTDIIPFINTKDSIQDSLLHFDRSVCMAVICYSNPI